MRDEIFLNHQCVAYEIPSRFVTMSSMKFMQYSGYNVDIGIPIPNGNGRFQIKKESDLVLENLNQGKGVYFDGSVFFLKEAISGSSQHRQFMAIYSKSKKKIERNCVSESEQYLLDHVKEVHQVPIVKSIYQLYVTGLFSSDVLLKKLKFYLEEEQIAKLIQLFEAEREAA